MTVAVLIPRDGEIARLVHWAALFARAEGGDVLLVSVAERAEEERLEEPPLAEAEPALREAVERARRLLPGLPAVSPEEPDGKGPPPPGFTLVLARGPDPAAAVLEAVRKAGADLLLLPRGPESGGEPSLRRLFAEAPCVTLLLRPGGDEAETAERILVPPVAAAGLALAVGATWLALGAALLFATNITAIILGAAFSLSAGGVRTHHLFGRSKRWVRRLVLGGFLVVALVLIPLSFRLARIVRAHERPPAAGARP